MSYTEFKDGYAIESSAAGGTYGTSTIIAATQTYLWGVVSQKAVHPSPRTSVIYRATGALAQEVPATYLWKRQFDLTGMYAVGLQNGILLWAGMGKSTTAGAGPYTHTIIAPDDGAQLPSFTIQHERTGTATDWASQFTGCKVANLTLTCGQESKYLIGRMDWIAQKAADPAFVLTNDPILPPTATISPYYFNGMTRTYNGASIDGLVDMELTISPDLTPVFAHKWDAGTWTGQWLHSLIEGTRKQYKLTLHLTPGSDDIWDDSVSQATTSDFVFKWTKSANDYIQITCTDCPIIYHELQTPEVGNTLIDVVECEPRSVTIEVKDMIAGGYYGE